MARKSPFIKWLWIFTLVGLGVVLFAGGGIIGTWLFLKSRVKGHAVTIPDLYGLSEQEARKRVEDEGLVLIVDQSKDVNSSVIPEGKVLLQIPRPKRVVKSGRQVEITLSAGPKVTLTPNVCGKTAGFADVLLKQAEISTAVVSRTPSNLEDDGKVLAQFPLPGETMGLRQGASLLISSGPAKEYFVMPNLVGKTYNRARNFLDRHQFRVVSKYRSQDPLLGQVILEQTPKAGFPVTKSQYITLVINKDY